MSLKEDIEEIQEKAEILETQSFARSILEDYKKANKRMFTIIIIILIMWFSTIGYLVYLLNDISYVETTQEIDDVDSIENSNITNGDIYGED